MYYRPSTNQTFETHSEIRQSFLSGEIIAFFSEVITDEDLAARGVYPLSYDKPEVSESEVADPFTVELVDGVWTQRWAIRNATQEELQAKQDALKALVPKSVTRRQARQALLIRGMLDAVPEAISAIEDPLKRGLVQIEWEDSLEFIRSRPTIIELGAAIGLDEDGLDELFTFAATL